MYEAMSEPPDVIAYFENRNKKRLRKFLYGGNNGAYKHLYKKLYKYPWPEERQIPHHYSHACAGYFTSTFENATIVVIDAIGEFETATVWDAEGSNIAKRQSLTFPISYGLFYSAFTQLVGLKPGEDEYILMGMAAYGDPMRHMDSMKRHFSSWNRQSYNFHRGIKASDIGLDIKTEQDKYDVAATAQNIYEQRLQEFMLRVRASSKSKNLVFMGGCALNCAANTKLLGIWDHVWIMPNPGDAGSSLGAALAVHGQHVRWRGPYLGHSISDNWPIDSAFQHLKNTGIVAVAAQRAEFGPRALGNRSLLANPCDPTMKDRVNEIKKRQKFRPFAPVIMEEHVSDWFELDRPAPYMQYAVKAKHPEAMPAVVHADGTARVQTVNPYQHFELYELLSRWYEHTGVPVLLNTSLNIKGQPIVNDIDDIVKWAKMYPNVPIAGYSKQEQHNG